MIIDMLPNCRILSKIKQEDDYEAWKAVRSRGVGGSEIGAIMGVSKFATPRTVYLRKTMRYDENLEEKQMKEHLEWGHLLEPVVAKKFTLVTGMEVAESPATLCHKDYQWALANIDRFIVDQYGNPMGILECKTAHQRMLDDWENGEFYLSYMYQLNWYLGITGLKYGAMACLVGGRRFFNYEFFFDEGLFNKQLLAADRFWNYNVKELVEPELTGYDADTELMKETYQKVVKKDIPLTEAEELATFYRQGKQQLKDLEAQLDEAKNKMCEMLGENESGYTPHHIIKWSARKRTGVDSAMLKEEYPLVYEACKVTTAYRVFTIKGGKDDEEL